MTTYRTTWIPPDHYAEIQRQLGARDVGVVALPETPATSPETGLGATNTPYCDRTGIREDERGAEGA